MSQAASVVILDDYDECCERHTFEDPAVRQLVQAVEREHDTQLHPGAFRFCREPLCTDAQAVLGG